MVETVFIKCYMSTSHCKITLLIFCGCFKSKNLVEYVIFPGCFEMLMCIYVSLFNSRLIKIGTPNHFKGDGLSFQNFSKKRSFRIFPWKERVCVYLCVWYHGKVLLLHSFFISMVYFLVSLSMLRKNTFLVSKYACI